MDSTTDIFSTESIDSLLSDIEGIYQQEKPGGPDTAEPSAPPSDVFEGDLSSPEELEAAGFNDPQISEILLGLERGIPVSRYAKTSYTWTQMREIRHGLLAEIDTSLYENPLYSVGQMREIRMGILNHVDVSVYANLVFSATDMRKIRKELSSIAYHSHPNGYGYCFPDEKSGLIMRISDDCMDAYISLPENIEERFSPVRLTKILQNYEITYGLLPLELERFSRELPRDTEIKIAHGVKSEAGTDGYYEYHFNRLLKEKPRLNEDGSVDYSRIKVTESVKEGQLLATYHPATLGKSGSTVSGIVLHENPGQDLPRLMGDGIIFDPETNTYHAAYSGNVFLIEENYTLNVYKMYTIVGDATRYTGSTEYDGTVIVRGDVRNMARIKASGDIIVDGTVESAELDAGHNIMIRGGANAAGKGLIQAQGSIKGSFFESANLKAGGTIEANYFLGCNVETDDKIIAKGEKSLIQGGQVFAALGIEAFNFRPYGGSKTKVEVGNISKLTIKQQENTKEINKTSEEIQKLRDGISKLLQVFDGDLAEERPIYQRTCAALEQKELQLEHLQMEREHLEHIIEKTMKAYINVTGTMEAGIIITVNGKRTTLERKISVTKITSRNFPEEEGAARNESKKHTNHRTGRGQPRSSSPNV